jgi:hypothetical protein
LHHSHFTTNAQHQLTSHHKSHSISQLCCCETSQARCCQRAGCLKPLMHTLLRCRCCSHYWHRCNHSGTSCQHNHHAAPSKQTKRYTTDGVASTKKDTPQFCACVDHGMCHKTPARQTVPAQAHLCTCTRHHQYYLLTAAAEHAAEATLPSSESPLPSQTCWKLSNLSQNAVLPPPCRHSQ